MAFADIAIISVDGRRGELRGAQYALIHSARELPGAAAVLFSPERPATLLPGIRHVAIGNLGYLEYSLFVVYALHRLIDADFVLIVQEDGWVLDGRQWRDDYRQYDYIGAPTQFRRVMVDGAARYVRGSDAAWSELRQATTPDMLTVMNGGFSLRSRRLLAAPTLLNIPFVIPPPTELSGPPYDMHWTSNSHNEDVQLCIDMRASLEAAGLKFAPLAVARHFAVEHLHPADADTIDLSRLFGHHSRLRRLTSLDPLTVQFQESRQFLSQVYGEHVIAKLLQQRGYRIETVGG